MIPMLIGCLLITHLPIKAELARRPELASYPVALLDGPDSRPVVLDASHEAVNVHPGQSLAQAFSRCRDLVTLPADLVYLQAVCDGIDKRLAGVVDRVEPADMGRFYLGLDGMADMYGGETPLLNALLETCNSQLRPRLGVALGKFPAFCAAALATAGSANRVSGDTTAIATWLATLPTSWLPLQTPAIERLQNFGIHTLGQLAALPLPAVQAQLGWDGLRAWELARGVDHEPLYPCSAPEQVTERLAFPFPLVGAQMLKPALEALTARAWGRSTLRNRCAGCVQLAGSLTEGGVWRYGRTFRIPACSPDSAVSALVNGLAAVGRDGASRYPSGELDDLSLTLADFRGDAGIQSGLWPEHRRGLELSRLPDIAGNVDRIVPLEPNSPLPERRRVFAGSLRPLSMPEPVQVAALGSGVPQRVNSRPVKRVQDFWEVETEWWRPRPVHRRYCLLELDGGRMETVFQDRSGGGWYRQSG